VEHTGWYKRPDWFLVLGRSDSPAQSELRLSYLIWQEHIAPFLMVELLSPGTEAEDLGSATRVSPEETSGACPARQTLRVVGKPPTKWQVYEQILRIPYYAVFDRYSNQFRMFCLQGTKYVEQIISGQGFWFDDLQLGLGVWTGAYEGVEGQWLCWYDAAGNWVLSKQERILKAEQQAENAEQRAENAEQQVDRERQRADLLATKLRELGLDVDEML
jgi:Putative restriction endonuclease